MSPAGATGGGAAGAAAAARAAAASDDANGLTRGALVAELAVEVGAPHEARFIVDEVLGLGLTPRRSGPPSRPLDEAEVSAARTMASRRASGEPLQYVFGHWPFRRLDLFVDPRVLIPRPETEQVVEVALTEARRLAAAHDGGSDAGAGLVIADAGSGSGAIALSLATELGPRVVAEVWATDASTDALVVAESNLERVRRAQGTAAADLPAMTFVEGSWLEPLPMRLRGAVDLVVSNPPYVSEAEWEDLSEEVRSEPRGALVARSSSDGTAGLADAEDVLRQARSWLRRPGAVVIEIAPHQAEAAMSLASGLGYTETRVEQDLAGRPRVLVAHNRD